MCLTYAGEVSERPAEKSVCPRRGEWPKALPRRGRLPGGSDRSAPGSGALSLPEAGARRGEPGGEAESVPGRSPAP